MQKHNKTQFYRKKEFSSQISIKTIMASSLAKRKGKKGKLVHASELSNTAIHWASS
jgi:hypothetical protein